MSARKPLPEIAPCPSGCTKTTVVTLQGTSLVECACGWTGPTAPTERGAVKLWNRRSDEAAERRGARNVLEELRDHAAEMEEAYRSEGWADGAEACSYFSQFASLKLRTGKAIERGEVIPKREAEPEWLPKAKRGGRKSC